VPTPPRCDESEGRQVLGDFVVRRFGFVGVLVAGALAISSATIACDAAASDTLDHTSVHTRKLQTELMVSALYCDQQARYNAFVRRFEGELVSSGRQLKALFVTRHGARHAIPKLDAFLTRLANKESQRRLTLGIRYCRDAQDLFTRVLRLPQRQLVTFASERAATPLPQGRLTRLQTTTN